MGTDALGRNMAAGIFYGARISLLVGFASVAVALVFGILVGAYAGYYGGWVDNLLMRATELFQTIPQFMLAIVVVAIFGPTIKVIVFALAVVSWPAIARLVRGEFLVIRERAYIQGCIVLGMSDSRIIFTQILPNALSGVMVMSTVLVATAILMESALSFLGFGDPNVITWGSMIGSGRNNMRRRLVHHHHPRPLPADHRPGAEPGGQRVDRPDEPAPAQTEGEMMLDLNAEAPLLEVENLEVTVAGHPEARILRGVTFAVHRGETLAIVGESGCGKSMTSLAVMGLLPDGVQKVAGSLRLDGHELPITENRAMRKIRAARIGMVFQEPMAALNPVFPVGKTGGRGDRLNT